MSMPTMYTVLPLFSGFADSSPHPDGSRPAWTSAESGEPPPHPAISEFPSGRGPKLLQVNRVTRIIEEHLCPYEKSISHLAVTIPEEAPAGRPPPLTARILGAEGCWARATELRSRGKAAAPSPQAIVAPKIRTVKGKPRCARWLPWGGELGNLGAEVQTA